MTEQENKKYQKMLNIAARFMAFVPILIFAFFIVDLNFFVLRCNNELYVSLYKDGDFTYSTQNLSGCSGEYYTLIESLTDEGKSKSILTVPFKIKSGEVMSLTYRNSSSNGKRHEDRGYLESDNLQTLYILPNPSIHVSTVFEKCMKLRKIVFQNQTVERATKSYDFELYGNQKVYVPRFDDEIEENGSAVAGQIAGKDFYYANVTFVYRNQLFENSHSYYDHYYYYKYEKRDFEKYWVDNFGYGEKIDYVPAEPTREGYEFTGWYKDEECTELWNFENDTLPKARYNDNGEEIYQETKLYAGWKTLKEEGTDKPVQTEERAR